MLKNSKKYRLNFIDYSYIVMGSLITALGFQLFLLPNSIVAGGVSGLSIVTYELFGWFPAYFQYAVNVPLLLICFIFLGKDAGFKTVLGSLLLPFFLQFIGHLDGVTDQPLLASIFGGVITGFGLGLVFRAKASTGGTSIIVQLSNQYLNIPLSISIQIIDGSIILLALITFDIETVLYSILSLYLLSRTIDRVQVGFNNQKNVFIISENAEEIRHEVIHTLDRGISKLVIEGGYDRQAKDMLMVVIQEREFTALKQTILNIDNDAFVVATPASEVLGRGFSLHKYFPSTDSLNELNDIE